MKLTVKIFLVISLFCSVAFAEGDMGSGNYCQSIPMGCRAASGTVVEDTTKKETGNSIFNLIREYLFDFLG